MSTTDLPRRGEIWQADLGGGCLSPVLIISTDALANLPIRLIVPLRPWEDRFANLIWIQRLEKKWPTQLGDPHAADLLQIRSIELNRLRKRIGRAPATKMDEIAAAVALVVDYQLTNS
ncbi:type II toxin-antitoxin system PemK/MazF family toxin [Chloroflexus sp.]|uniref:type II toxin-antitoxin system PemK/MazF family toxin n=1 Tax=Chloroflexus sp. TaxID=1904827 RepID=UPI00261B46DE|nr:type II toxin-antitoxin system PemK/MazF family toxin [uncultured Chloroflexus sp.]